MNKNHHLHREKLDGQSGQVSSAVAFAVGLQGIPCTQPSIPNDKRVFQSCYNLVLGQIIWVALPQAKLLLLCTTTANNNNNNNRVISVLLIDQLH